MRNEPNLRIEHHRYTPPGFESPPGVNWGCFMVPVKGGAILRVISSGTDEEHGWEHVSVSLQFRTPTWDEMDEVRNLFWRDDECVMQLHPPKDVHVNYHEHCLHLWRPLHAEIPMPPLVLIGPLERKP